MPFVPRVVVDNSGGVQDARFIGARSVGDSSTPSCAAKSSNGKCQAGGTFSRHRQLDTACAEIPSADPSAVGPPKRSMISEALVMPINIYTTGVDKQAFSTRRVFKADYTNGDNLRLWVDDPDMALDQSAEYDRTAALDRALVELRDQTGIDALTRGKRDGSAQKAARFFGVTPQRFGNWRTRGLAEKDVFICASALGVRPDFLTGRTQERGRHDLPDSSAPSNAALATEIATLKSQVERLTAQVSELIAPTRARR